MYNLNETVAYIAKPTDSRCSWWSVQLPDSGLELTDKKLNSPYLHRNADLELTYGQMLIDSEANHHRQNRGYTVQLIVSFGDDWSGIIPSAKIKKYIKEHNGQDLMHESGDVAGCVRIAVWLRRQPDLKIAFNELKTL